MNTDLAKKTLSFVTVHDALSAVYSRLRGRHEITFILYRSVSSNQHVAACWTYYEYDRMCKETCLWWYAHYQQNQQAYGRQQCFKYGWMFHTRPTRKRRISRQWPQFEGGHGGILPPIQREIWSQSFDVVAKNKNLFCDVALTLDFHLWPTRSWSVLDLMTLGLWH